MTTGCNTRSMPESAPNAIGHITLRVKPAGERRTGNPSAPFDRAGAGDGRVSHRASPRPYSLRATAWTTSPRMASIFTILSPPGAFEGPKALVFFHSTLKLILKGDTIVADFVKFLATMSNGATPTRK